MLFVGNLIFLKGLQLALPAIANAISSGVRLHFTIVGDGPYRPHLEELVQELRLQASVKFRGRVPRDEVLSMYQDHDLFLFPSLRDSGGMAVLEAMASQLPVLCLDIGGPALSVDAASGIRIPVISPNQVVEDLTQQLTLLGNNPQNLRRMGDAAQVRANTQYSWDRKGDLLKEMYAAVSRID
jgi:glycosyltransferase involved in cell wall biosynthesis